MQITPTLGPGQAPGTAQPTLPVDANEIRRRQRLAEALMSQGMQTERIRHPLEAVGHVMQTGVGALWGDSARKAGTEREAFEMAQAQAAKDQDMAQAQARHQALAQALQGQTGPRYERAQMLLSNPATAAQGAEMALGLLKEDPLERQMKEAKLAQLQREMQGGVDGPSFGKTGAIFQGPDGNFYSVQFADDGSRRIEPMQAGDTALTPAKGVMTVGDTLRDSATGQVIDNVAPNLAGAEAAKLRGKTEEENRLNFPKTQGAFQSYIEKADIGVEFIDEAMAQANQIGTTGFTGWATNYVPGTPAHDLKNTINQIVSNLGFDKLQDMRNNSPTGGALGQVSNYELQMLQAVWGSVQQSQTRGQLLRNLARLKRVQARARKRIESAYQADLKKYGPQAMRGLDPSDLPGMGMGLGEGMATPESSGVDYKSLYGLGD